MKESVCEPEELRRMKVSVCELVEGRSMQESVCESGEPGRMQGSVWGLGNLEACKRASVILVSRFEVSHYARFARVLARL